MEIDDGVNNLDTRRFRGVVKYDVETGTEETVEDAYWAAAADLG